MTPRALAVRKQAKVSCALFDRFKDGELGLGPAQAGFLATVGLIGTFVGALL